MFLRSNPFSQPLASGFVGCILLLLLAQTILAQPSTNSPVQDLNLVKINGGTFERGAPLNKDRLYQQGTDWDEGPVHQVSIAKYQLSVNQVTMEEFTRFMPSYRKRVQEQNLTWDSDSPAVLVTWTEAHEYCEWLTNKTSLPCRLPTETEWEWAARNAEQLNLAGVNDGIQEWCHDWWAPYTQAIKNSDDKVLANPIGPATGTIRVVRDGGGGSVRDRKPSENERQWDPQADFRFTDRSGTVVDDWRSNLGFRVAVGKLPTTADKQVPNSSDLPTQSNSIVSVEKIDWKVHPNNDQPYFMGGFKYIDLPDDTEFQPYWLRHHVPSITWCDNGDLLITAYTAPHDNSDQTAILLTRKRHQQKQWDPPELFFIAPDRNVTSAALFNRGNGIIHHYNGLGNNLCNDFSMIKRVSQDNGVTWSQPKIVHRFPPQPATEENLANPRLWPHMDLKFFSNQQSEKKGIIMSTDIVGSNDFGSALFISSDDGDSWQELTRTGWQKENYGLKGKQAGWIAGIHAPVEQLDDGSLLAFGRSTNIEGQAPFSLSTDFGKTWTYSASPFPPILNAQRPALLRLKEGPLLLISYTDTTFAVRDKKAKGLDFVDAQGDTHNAVGMFAAISFDEGKTWTHQKLIPNWWKKPWRSRHHGYLSCVQTPDQRIHLISSSHYYQFNLAWLKEPMPVPE